MSFLRLIPGLLFAALMALGAAVSLQHNTTASRPVGIALSIMATLPLLAYVNSKVRYYVRLASFLGGLAACSTWGVVVSVALAIAGKAKNSNYVVARSFHGVMAPLLGMSFTVEGEEHLQTKPAVVVGNHQTMVDILYLGRVFPKECSIMAKKELQWTPLLGQFMTLSNAVFIDRAKRGDAVAAFAKVAEIMKKRMVSLFIFPEGTRTPSAKPFLLPFKKGAFHLAVAAQVPIVPIVCENYHAGYSAADKRFDGGNFIIKVLPPISTEGYTSSSADIASLADKTREIMLEALEDLGRRRQETNRLKAVFAEGTDAEEAAPLNPSSES